MLSYTSYAHVRIILCIRVWAKGRVKPETMFDETYVLMIFPTYISFSFGSNRNICFSLRKTFDPRGWGFRHLYILHSQLSRPEGPKHMLTDAIGRPKVMFDVPKVMSKRPQPPPT